MASSFIARPSVCLGTAAASFGISAICSSDGGSSSSVLHPTRAAASGTAISFGRPPKLGYFKERIVSQEQWSPFWSSFESTRRNSGLSLQARAKRKPSKGGDLSQQEAEEELDEDLQVGLNEISTEALKAMLSEDNRQVAQVRKKVEYLGEYLVRENQLDAARFMLILRGMLDHEVVPQKVALKGAYKKAFDKITSVIEDSGWVLKQEGADVGGVEMVDDELMPPVLNPQY